MTGIPPFTDETPEKVFDNILNMRMEWPEDEGECYDLKKKIIIFSNL